MVEDPPGDASGGLLGHVHLHGTVAGLHECLWRGTAMLVVAGERHFSFH